MVAFARALEQGANALETDVHVTKDGKVVVFHDDDGVRMAGVDKAIAACTWSEVRQWDVGTGFVAIDGSRPFVGRSLAPPLLQDVLSAFPGIPVNIDVKPEDPAQAARVVSTVAEAGAAERVLLTSFHDDVIAAVRAAGHQGPTGLAHGEVRRLWLWPLFLLRRAGGLPGRRVQIPVRSGRVRFDTRRFIDKAHALRIAVDFWVINDAAEGRRLVDLGADGLMSDAPRLLAGLADAS